MKTKVARPNVADDPVARFAIAVPSAIAITALLVVLARCQPAERTPAEPPFTTTAVVLEHAPPPTPRPTRPPTPPPTLPPVVRATPALVPQRAAPRAHRAAGGGHAAPRTKPHIALQTVAGTGGGAGPGAGNGLGAGDAGGNGNGSGGTGAGTVNADAPCGTVDLIPFQSPDHAGAVTYEYINATVTFPDGHTESDEFPYRWGYSDPAADPWSAQNMRDTNFITRVQPPPPGANTSRFPDVIRYILDHTRADGTTILQECPRQR